MGIFRRGKREKERRDKKEERGLLFLPPVHFLNQIL